MRQEQANMNYDPGQINENFLKMILTCLNENLSSIPVTQYEIDLVEKEDELLRSMNSIMGSRKLLVKDKLSQSNNSLRSLRHQS